MPQRFWGGGYINLAEIYTTVFGLFFYRIAS